MNTYKKCRIVFSTDNNFVKQLAVTIASILINAHTDEQFDFYVLDGGITQENKEKINHLKSIKNFEIKYLQVNKKLFKNCPLSAHFKLPTYYRIILPSLLDFEKVMYMDCDVIVKSSLSEFYNINLKNNYATVVEDMSSQEIFFKKHIQKNLGLTKYFNAGIMLLNLEKMRNDNIEEKCFEFIKKTPEKILFVDQCVMNSIFAQNVIFVDNIWNFQYNIGLKNIYNLYKKNKNKIKILHFACSIKPWQLNKKHPCFIEWFYYLSKTPFKVNLFYVFFDYFILQKFRNFILLLNCLYL